jgi:hypothetical protein
MEFFVVFFVLPHDFSNPRPSSLKESAGTFKKVMVTIRHVFNEGCALRMCLCRSVVTMIHSVHKTRTQPEMVTSLGENDTK